MLPVEETVKFLHFENNTKRIDALQEIKIVKAITSYHRLNIMQNNNPNLQNIATTSRSDSERHRQSPYMGESSTMCNTEF